MAFDARNDFLVTAVFALMFAQHFQFPALLFCVTGIHAKQITGEDRRLITAGAGANFQKDIFIVVRVAGQHQQLQFLGKTVLALLRALEFVFGHVAQFRVLFLQHDFGIFDRRQGFFIIVITGHDGTQLCVFLRQATKLVLLANYLRVGEQGIDLFQAFGQMLQFVADGFFHGLSR